jgi:hypothetical protein
MRFYEFSPIKHIKPFNPAQARIYAIKQQKQKVNKQLKAEQDRQKQAKAAERVRTAQQALTKARLG